MVKIVTRRSSKILHFIENFSKKELNIPENTPLPQSNGSTFPFVIVVDEAFGLSQNVMRSYGGRTLLIVKGTTFYRMYFWDSLK